MTTPLGFPTPADSTRLALVFNQMRALANAVDSHLRTSVVTGTVPVSFANTSVAGPIVIPHSLGVVPSSAFGMILDASARTVFAQLRLVSATEVAFWVVHRDSTNLTLETTLAYRIEK